MKTVARKYGDLVATLADRTTRLVQGAAAQRALLAELAEARQLLGAHEAMLARGNDELGARTADLVATRALLAERTGRLEQMSVEAQKQADQLTECAEELVTRTAELVTTRATLQERTLLLESTSAQAAAQTDDVTACMATLVTRSAELVDRTGELVATRALLGGRDEELAETRALLVERTELLGALDAQNAAALAELSSCRDAMAVGAAALSGCTEELIAVRLSLKERNDELVDTRSLLVARTGLMETLSAQHAENAALLVQRDSQIVEINNQFDTLRQSRDKLAEMFALSESQLSATTLELRQVRTLLVERTDCLEAAHAELVRNAEDRKRPVRFAVHTIYQGISYKLKRKASK